MLDCRSNKWKKRGLAIIPNRYCLAFGITFLNQAGALLHVYTDGSVLLSHGGMEMGQGLHTKMIQVCREIECYVRVRGRAIAEKIEVCVQWRI